MATERGGPVVGLQTAYVAANISIVIVLEPSKTDASKRSSGSAILKRFIFAGAQRLLDGVFVVLLETRINQRTTESDDGHVLVKVPSTRMNSNWRPKVGVTRPAALVSFRQILKFVTRRRLGGPRFVCASLTHHSKVVRSKQCLLRLLLS